MNQNILKNAVIPTQAGIQRRYELLIFDWDGTLMDSAGQIVASFQTAIELLKLPARRNEQISELIGLGLTEAFSRLYPELDDTARLDVMKLYGQHYRSLPSAHAPLFAGIPDTLARLQAQGYQLAIATGKSRAGLNRALQQTGLSAYFCASRCADETASKPDPRMLEELLLHTATEPERALMIGDTEYDMAMARAAGIPALGVACGVHDKQRLLAAGAMAVVQDAAQIPGWLADGHSGVTNDA